MGWRLLPARWVAIPSAPTSPCPGPSNPFPASRSPDAAPSPPPCSCWEWRLHFSCHLHSQSIRTPQLSRLAELGGRRRRERVLWGLSPPHRSHSAPDCFLLRRAQPAGPGGSGNPWSSFSLLGTHDARERGTGGWGRRALPAPLLCRFGLALGGRGRQVRGEGSGRQVVGPAALASLHEPALLPRPGCRLTSSLPPPPPRRPREEGRSLGRKGFPSSVSW